MAKKPKIILGFAILFLISLAFISFSLQKITNNDSTAELSVGVNNFKISFNILPEDRPQFEKARDILTFSKSIEKGVSFELDSTSSAQLAFVSPVKVIIDFPQDSIKIDGLLNRPYTLNSFSPHQIKLPGATNIAIASASLSEFAKTKLFLPDSLHNWIETHKSENSIQYFANVQQDINIYLFQSSAPIEELKSLESREISYIEESHEDTKIIHLTLKDSQNPEAQTISIAKIDNLVFITPSQEIIKEFINFQKSPKDEIDFPRESQELTYAIYAKNNSDQFTQILRSLIVKSQPQTLEFAKNIDSFYLALSKKSFSALIVIK